MKPIGFAKHQCPRCGARVEIYDYGDDRVYRCEEFKNHRPVEIDGRVYQYAPGEGPKCMWWIEVPFGGRMRRPSDPVPGVDMPEIPDWIDLWSGKERA